MIKISVVVPVYNVELYLEEALNSLINQSLKEIEIIIINDGSTDNSLEIIRDFEKKDSRIIVISQINQGQSVARNQGIKIANGKYIYFMDSDDYIDLDTLELCYKKSEKEKLDFLYFDAISFSKDLNIKIFNYDRSELLEKIETGKECLKKLKNIKKYRCSPCLHFINLNYLRISSLDFYPGIIHEDELFTYKLYLNAERVSYINRKFFKRRLRENSTMTSPKGEKNIIGYLTVAKELTNLLESEIDIEKINLINIRVSDMVSSSVDIVKVLNKNLQKKYKQKIETEFENYLNLKIKLKLYYPKLFSSIKKIKEMLG